MLPNKDKTVQHNDTVKERVSVLVIAYHNLAVE
jgi:hypothetical protein